MRALVVATVGWCLAGALTLNNALAEEIITSSGVEDQKTEIATQINKIEQTRKARLSLLPPGGILFRVAKPEGYEWGFACPYVTQDRSRIESLIELLKHGDLIVVEGVGPAWLRKPNERITLELADGTVAGFAFTSNVPDVGVRGNFYPSSASVGLSYVTAKAALPEEIVAWAVRTGASVPINSSLDDIRTTQGVCDYFARTQK